MTKKQTPHDGSYRRLFSHAVMAEDLIRRYVAPPWIDQLEFSTLEMVPAHYVSDELEQRESDVVWRLRYAPSGDWFYVYILIEFQSSVLRFMAIRVLAYIMLLYEEQSSGLEEIRRIIDTLIDVLDDPELRELRRDMATWVRRAILQARLPGVEIPELQDLQEAKIMLAERAATWPKQWMAEGFQKGREEGRTSGLLEGQRLALAELAREKFGSLEDRFSRLIKDASGEQVRQWLKNILKATTPEDVFRS